MALGSENLKALFSNPDKKLIKFIMNVCANSTPSGSHKKAIKKLANTKIGIVYKRKIIKRKGHLFMKRLVERNTGGFRKL